MALSTPRFREYRESSGTGTAITVNAPDYMEAGQLLVAVINRDATGAGGTNLPTISGGGWSWRGQSTYQSNSGIVIIYTKVASIVEPGSWTFTFTTATHTNVMVMSVTGFDPAAPATANILSQSSAGSTAWNMQTIPTTYDNSLVIYGIALPNAQRRVTYPATANSAREDTDAWTLSMGWELKATAGALGARTLNLDASVTGAATWYVAVAPNPDPMLGGSGIKWRMSYDPIQRQDVEESEQWQTIPDAGGITAYQAPGFGSDWYPAQFYRDPLGWVHFRGMIKGPVDVAFYTLPSGYAPLKTTDLLSMGQGAGSAPGVHSMSLNISSAGALTIKSANIGDSSADWFSLSGLSFRASPSVRPSRSLRDASLEDVALSALGNDFYEPTYVAPVNGQLTGIENSSSTFGSVDSAAVVRDLQGQCCLYGGKLLTATWAGGAAILPAGSLPLSFRPAYNAICFMGVNASKQFKRVDVGSDGSIMVMTAGSFDNGGYFLNRVQWRADGFSPTGTLLAKNAGLPVVPGDFSAASGWTNASLANGWVNYGGSYAPAGYYRDAFGRVHLRGLIRTGGIGTVAFTLPPNLRPVRHPGGGSPTEGELFAVVSNEALGRVDIRGDGSVVPNGPSQSAWVSLEGISFRCIA